MIFVQIFFVFCALSIVQSSPPVEEKALPIIGPVEGFAANTTRKIVDFIKSMNLTLSGIVQTIDNDIAGVLGSIQSKIDSLDTSAKELEQKVNGLRGCVLGKLEEIGKDGLQTVSNTGGCALSKVQQVEDLIKDLATLGRDGVLFFPEIFINLDACTINIFTSGVIACYMKEVNDAAAKFGTIAKETAVTVADGTGVIAMLPTLPASLPTCLVSQIAKFGINATMIGGTFGVCAGQNIYTDLQNAFLAIKGLLSRFL